MRTAAVVLLAALVSAQSQPASKPLEFRGMAPGMTYDEVAKAVTQMMQERWADCINTGPGLMICNGFVQGWFMDNRLVLVRFEVTRAFFDGVKRALLDKYKDIRPNVSVDTFTNAYGAKSQGQSVGFHSGGRTLVLREIDVNVTDRAEPDHPGSVTVSDDRQLREYDRRASAAHQPPV